MSERARTTGRVLPVGDRALLVECDGSADALVLWRRLHREPPCGVVEPVVAARTVLVRVAEGRQDAVRCLLEEILGEGAGDEGAGTGATSGTAPVPQHREVVVETVYDGEDLTEVAAHLGWSVEELVARHGATGWTSAFLGFAPGFAYLRSDARWPDVPRRASPRTRVPAGSVALAGPWSAVYPSASPGGWQLVGHTDAPVWDVGRAEPALLLPGTTVRFRPVRERARVGWAEHAAPPAGPADVATPPAGPAGVAPRPALEVLGTGPLCLVQDLGRRGYLSLGVPTSGALDRRAAARANRLVGNTRAQAVLEVLLGGLAVRALADVVVAVTGAPAPVTLRLADSALVRPGPGRPVLVPEGAELHLGAPATGLRTYLAVRGGLDLPLVLGSRATDVLSGLGPPPLRAGDVLGVLPPPGEAVPAGVDDSAYDVPPGPEHQVRVLPGPRADWLTPGARALLHAHAWTVTDRSNRVGLRLAGPVLERAETSELASEGTVPGAVQVPPEGQPVIFLADHPVTGGYPVVAVVVDADLDVLGQVRPGERLHLVAVEPD
ncbi:5-oxoprolinase/urea amidolyase family protein [Actinotalea sp. Marseille-Q4924]|uniref:5-oxoprolinase subunit B/C family protein n=1 Tax=Actinotalea sp. Marseille-Q4924 TaxID=2866571 RepID=UPI001CE48BA5|nr:5-oxoprolinase/urea amidolyase family protein [Actinotalea sp. Marseille-Q4924]